MPFNKFIKLKSKEQNREKISNNFTNFNYINSKISNSKINKKISLNKEIHILSWSILFIILILAFYNINNSVLAQQNNQTQNQTNISQLNNLSSNLITWTTNNTYVNETIYIYALYTNATSNLIIGNCSLNIDNQSNLMLFNQTFYYYNQTFNENKTYYYEINCSSNEYESKNLSGILTIQTNLIYQNNLTGNQSNNTFNNSNNTINNTINFDLDNDGYNLTFDCNDNNPFINPGMNEILYNNLDDDCNPETIDYLFLDITTNKQNYNSSEIVQITINAMNYSDTYLTINTPTNLSYVYIFSNKTYPITQNFSLTAHSGKYTIDAINYYENYSLQKSISFNVSSNFNVEIFSNVTEAYENEKIRFKAIITGNTGNVNLIWNMDDNNQIYLNEFDYNYSNARTYNVVLLATDNINQFIATKQIKINKKHFLKVKVIDNETNEIIENATIKLDSESVKVNSTGEYEFFVTNKTYNIKVSADNYYSYNDDIKINNSLYFTVKLVKNFDYIIPEIQLLNPQNNSNIDSSILNSTEFKFKFIDNNNAECSILFSDSLEWWQELGTLNNLNSNTEYSFKPSLENEFDLTSLNKLYWKIKCIDEQENIAYSPIYSLNLNSQNNENEQNLDINANLENTNETIETYQVIENIYSLIPDFESYSPDDKKIVDYLDLETTLKDAKRKLEMANRDLFNLRYKPDTDSIIAERDNIYKRIDEIKDQTPLSVSSKKKVTFVDSITDEEFKNYFEKYLILKNQNQQKNNKALLESNKLLQKKATIETTAYNVEIKYISGRSEEITLIVKNIDSNKISNTKLVLFIPKEIIDSTDSISFVTNDYNILEKDPVFEYDLTNFNEIVFYIKDSVSLELLPKSKALLFTSQLSEENKITGFSIFDNLGFSEQNKKIFIIEIIILFILLGIYLYFYFANNQTIISIKSEKNSEISEINNEKQNIKNINSDFAAYEKDMKKYYQTKSGFYNQNFNQKTILNTNSENELLINKKNNNNLNYNELNKILNLAKNKEKINYILSLISKAELDLINQNIKESALKYIEIKFLYDLLDKHDKKLIRNRISLILDEITLYNINELYDFALYELSQNNFEKALEYYNEISIEYEKLSEKSKNLVYGKCCELSLLINNNLNLLNIK